ncbi:MAG: ABC transporter permease, partial [FCB group bacterium]|nr:ABC transporter permease [FCB group bacterium]
MIKILKKYEDAIYSLAAILLAFLVGAVLIQLSGFSVIKAYTALFNGAFGSVFNITQTFMNTIPLIFTGLAVAIGFKSGLFNIGGEGQMYLGAFATAITAIYLGFLPGYILIPLALIMGGFTGSVWSFLPGYLKAKTGAHEVVTTIMMNYIGILATSYLLLKYFKEKGPIPQTVLIPESARLPELIEYSRLTWAIFIAVFVIIIIDIFFKRTKLGYEIQTVGENRSAAEYAGINSNKM